MSARFKVGDRVTALPPPETPGYDEAWASWPNPGNVGRTGTVKQVGHLGLEVEFGPNDRDYARFPYWAKADAVTRFPVGTRVRVRRGGEKGRGPLVGFYPHNIGREGTVVERGLGRGRGPTPVDAAARVWVDFGGELDCGYPENLVAVDDASPAPAFTPGDVVTLKSGGPQMTVTAVDKGYVFTSWHLATGESESYQYPPEALCHK